jgi:dimeric dUTPase (all-alpha-NTP-PPase superfamily)
MLRKIFEMQDTLNSRFNASQKEIMAGGEDVQKMWVDRFCRVGIGEFFEVQKAVGGRWWKVDKDVKGWPHTQEELADVFHFFVSACLAAGMSAEDLYNAYMAKNQQNHVRPDWKINENVNQEVAIGQEGRI